MKAYLLVGIQEVRDVEFPSADAALRWWSSAEYTDLRSDRQRTTGTNMIFVEGVAEEVETQTSAMEGASQ